MIDEAFDDARGAKPFGPVIGAKTKSGLSPAEYVLVAAAEPASASSIVASSLFV